VNTELFTEADVYHGDPLRPDLDTPTPDAIVAGLSREDRRKRVKYLVLQSHRILQEAIDEHAVGGSIAARAVLFSGGSDSTALAYMMRHKATHAIHANTGIGIESTRQFVRDTCAAWGLPLIEPKAEGKDTYRALVLDQGFPGPAHHFKMYQRLKERQLRKARRELLLDAESGARVVFIAGRRRAESKRRESIPLSEREGRTIWVSPLAMWTKLDLNTYRDLHPDMPGPCEASSLIHMSGECLCGAFAHPGELDEIGEWFPEVKAEIQALEAEVRAAGWPEPLCRWGHGEGRSSKSGRLCSSCDTRQGDLFGGAA
jgi:hypothetical protein